jgi:N-acetylglucosamine kinase-like BadF-type ATPase
MILIADSGSTKTDWILTDGKETGSRFLTIGYNPYFIDSDNIYQSLTQKLVSQFDAAQIKKVIFYGAGCSTLDKAAVVHKALTKCFTNSDISVQHDMLAAARALLGDEKGFAAIIGTGSNTCLYDGKGISQNIDSLGYLLGDEGSGSYIGKKIIRDYMRGYLPYELHNKFKAAYQLTDADIFHALYKQPLPNRFLAGFCKFAHENKEHPHIVKIIRDSFTDLFENLVSRYPNYRKLEFNCVGSVAWIFKDILEVVADTYGMKVGRLIASPIEDLVKYHLKQDQPDQ